MSFLKNVFRIQLWWEIQIRIEKQQSVVEGSFVGESEKSVPSFALHC